MCEVNLRQRREKLKLKGEGYIKRFRDGGGEAETYKIMMSEENINGQEDFY